MNSAAARLPGVSLVKAGSNCFESTYKKREKGRKEAEI
jgi:hypothetical protein